MYLIVWSEHEQMFCCYEHNKSKDSNMETDMTECIYAVFVCSMAVCIHAVCVCLCTA